ncbi:hypothetical protein GLOTRDRAFT_100599 [Gloeophyllum trabeum ATCC 11539]|uniref:Uncharacterized protein n=1 Tax=Gloeophyllum trabeum (strain ATCC 11539 / FP-39264 / Madison 617) TaxID=670483 RepID=S7RL75_GLOTA|nr:uncharacterized protein GLOTRDRAFT_100599 [Gloeophyllum trabeum ATCC 11539]EPQ53419.1 hypothetical protein GLOTRDRAFT_100599 [Gloeophyllum trabeum ATCC 11539]
MHLQHPAPSSSPSAPSPEVVSVPRRLRRPFFLSVSSSLGWAYGRMERCTIVEGTCSPEEEGVDAGKLSSTYEVSSSWSIFPRWSIRRNDGAGGRSSFHSESKLASATSHAFHTSSFTRPTVVSGSNDICLLFPDTSKNVIEHLGVCGTASCACSCSCSVSPSCPSPWVFTSTTPSASDTDPGRVSLTFVNDVRADAGAVPSTSIRRYGGIDDAVPGRGSSRSIWPGTADAAAVSLIVVAVGSSSLSTVTQGPDRARRAGEVGAGRVRGGT